MKFTRASIFLLVASIIGLHSLIPHDHHHSEPFAFSAHSHSESFLDQIALGFHLGQIDGELEDIVFCSPVSLEHIFSFDFALFKLPFELNVITTLSPEHHFNPYVALLSESHHNAHSLRGPPQV